MESVKSRSYLAFVRMSAEYDQLLLVVVCDAVLLQSNVIVFLDQIRDHLNMLDRKALNHQEYEILGMRQIKIT